MKTKYPRFALVLLGIVSLTACDGYSSGPAGNGALVTGTYTGTVTISGAQAPLSVTFTLAQTGNSFTGTFTTSDTGGTASGTVTGSTATFTINQTAPCTGSFTGTATITNSGGHISGSYSGTSPCTGPISATFVVNRVAGTGPPGY